MKIFCCFLFLWQVSATQTLEGISDADLYARYQKNLKGEQPEPNSAVLVFAELWDLKSGKKKLIVRDIFESRVLDDFQRIMDLLSRKWS